MANDTWDLVPLLKKLVIFKSAYKTKYALDDSAERLMETLFSKGSLQVEGVEYNESFFVVSKMNSISHVLGLPALHKWEFHQMDFNSSLFHGYFHE